MAGYPLSFPQTLTLFPQLHVNFMAVLLGEPFVQLLYAKACFIVLLM